MPAGVYLHKKGQGGRKGRSGIYPRSAETRKKMGLAKKEQVLSPEARKKISIAHKGKKLTAQHLANVILSLPRGPKHWRWKGGYENTLMINRRRRALKLSAPGSHTLAEWQNLKAQYDWTCPGCNRREPVILLTEDHIVPLTKGGSNNIQNIQPLCQSCNSKKSTQIIYYKHAA